MNELRILPLTFQCMVLLPWGFVLRVASEDKTGDMDNYMESRENMGLESGTDMKMRSGMNMNRVRGMNEGNGEDIAMQPEIQIVKGWGMNFTGGTGMGMKTKNRNGTGMSMETGMGMKTGMKTEKRNGTGMSTGTGIGIKTGMGVKTGMGIKTGMKTEERNGTGMGMGLGTEIDVGMRTGTNMRWERRRKGVKTGMNMEMGTGMRIGNGRRRGINMTVGMDLGFGTGMTLRKRKKAGINGEAGTGTHMEGSEINKDVKTGTGMRMSTGTGINMRKGTGITGMTGGGVETGTNMEVGAGIRKMMGMGEEMNMEEDSGMNMGFHFSRVIEEPEPHPSMPQGDEIKDEWFDQKLNHANESEPTTWKQRFFRNEIFYKQALSQNITDMPIFVMIGGESRASASWMKGGNWIGLAIQHKALLFQLEHRFYGESKPTEDLSVENLVYLTSHQALADLAHFIVSMKREYGMTSANKVLCVGGSYPGSLAAWMRIRYPRIVHAALASSAPVLAKLDNSEYYDVVMKSMETLSSAKCTNTVKEAMAQMKEMSETQEGCDKLRELFSLCYPLDHRNRLDVQMFFKGQGIQMAYTVQNYSPNKSKPGRLTVADVCKILEDDSSEPDALKRYIKLNDAFRKGGCVPFSYDQYTFSLGNSTSWESEHARGVRQWIWQTCNEFGYFQISDDNDALLNKTVPTSLYLQTCRDVFTYGFTDSVVKEHVEYTNREYKGKFKAENVCYVQGSLDPWSALGIDAEQGAIVIEGVSHCGDMGTPSETDIPALKAGGRRIAECVAEALKS